MTERASDPTIPSRQLEEWRCWNCYRLIARLSLQPGSIVTIKCRCNCVNTRQVVPAVGDAAKH